MSNFYTFLTKNGDRRGRDRMVVESTLSKGVLDTTLCDKVCQ